MLNRCRPSCTGNNATIAGKSVNNIRIYCGRQTKNGLLRWQEIIATPIVRTSGSRQHTKSPISFTQQPDKKSAELISPKAPAVSTLHSRRLFARLRRCNVNLATETHGESDAIEIPSTAGEKPGKRCRSRAQKIRMRPRPATGTALVVCSSRCLSPRTRRHDRFSLLALRTSAASAKASRRSVTVWRRSGNRCGGQRPSLLR